jgi:hypothetical protein
VVILATIQLTSRGRGPRVAYKRVHVYRWVSLNVLNIMLLFLVSLLVNLLMRALNEPDEWMLDCSIPLLFFLANLFS